MLKKILTRKNAIKPHLLFPKLFLSAFLVVAISSCDKYQAKKLSGTYPCTVHYSTWSNFSSNHYDSTYTEVVDIKQDGRSITVFGNNIPQDSLDNENIYIIGNYHQFMTVQFRSDSVFIRKSDGGLGGGQNWDYSGAKQ